MKDKLTNLEKLIAILKDGKWHSSDELATNVSFRFGHTIFEARKKGYLIEKKQVANNQFEYRLLTEEPMS
jgi:biotin operon repressor